MTPTLVDELDLPLVNSFGEGIHEALGALAELRQEHWLAKTPVGYLVLTYEDAVAVLRDRRFHSALSLLPRLSGVEGHPYFAGRRPSILSMEGEEHSRLRRLVGPAFTPAAIDRLRPGMEEILTSLVDAVAAEGRCEVVQDICEPYPTPVICELLGAPTADAPLFSRWASEIFRIFNLDLVNDLPAISRASDELGMYVRSLIEERRRRPEPDLLSALIAVEEEGDRLSNDELVMLAESMLMAGTDTTRNQLACAVALLAGFPEQWTLLAEDPEWAPGAVEECMRYLGAVRATARFASEEVEYRGVRFPAGTVVSVTLAGANRDPAVWDRPDAFDITRPRSGPQITFGSGIHHCMGAALARAELQTALPLLARRMPGLRIDGEIEWKPPHFGIWGPARLPVRFDPTRLDRPTPDR